MTRWPACRAACPTGRRSTGRTRGCSRRSCRRRWRSRGATRRSPRGRQTLQTSLRPRALRRWRTRWSWCGPPWRAARTGRRRTSERRRKRKRREREEKDEEKREEKKGENERMRKEVLKEKKKGASWPTFQFASSHFCFLFPHLRFSLSRARASQLASLLAGLPTPHDGEPDAVRIVLPCRRRFGLGLLGAPRVREVRLVF